MKLIVTSPNLIVECLTLL